MSSRVGSGPKKRNYYNAIHRRTEEEWFAEVSPSGAQGGFGAVEMDIEEELGRWYIDPEGWRYNMGDMNEVQEATSDYRAISRTVPFFLARLSYTRNIFAELIFPYVLLFFMIFHCFSLFF